MSDVPKMVRQRAARQPTGEHPDANLLAAFAEGELTQTERAQVLAHLGTCAACRDVVALALPESAAIVPAATQPAKSWLRWPMLRWAGAAAAVVVVAAAIMLVKPHQPAFVPMKQTEIAVPADKTTAAKPVGTPTAAPLAPPPTDQVKRKDSAPAVAVKEEPKSKAFKREDTAGARGLKDAFGVEALNQAPALREHDQHAQPNKAAQLQAAAEPGNTRQVPAQSAKTQLQVPAATPATPQSPQTAAAGVGGGAIGGVVTRQKQAAVAPSPPALTAESVQVEAQSQAVAGQRTRPQLQAAPLARDSVEVPPAAPSAAANRAVRAPMTTVMMKAVAHRWRVSSQGELERSIDGGVNWEIVRVASTPVSFRSVSTVDHDVWAGGAAGALYHSADDGRTWTRVTVKALDMVLATDIARVEFTDALHGTVTTTNGVSWITGDAGVTWSPVAKPPR